MLDFSWNQWLSAVEKFTGSNKGRKVRRAKTAQIELLEDRALLTANLPIAVDDAYVVAQNGNLNGTTVLANDTDADADTIDQAVLQNTTTHGTLTLQTNGTFTYVPAANFTGVDSFTYFAVDSAHAETSAVRAVVRINVGSVVDAPPTATPTEVDVVENTTLDGGLSGNDPEEAALTFLPGTTSAVNGTVVIKADGRFLFTPTPGFTGAASFTFRVTDGTSTSANATVKVNVLPAGNTAPVGTPANFNIPGGALFTGTLAATDADGDPLVFAGGTTAASHGAVTIGPDGTFTYLPAAGYKGPDSFTFTVNDGQTSSAQATVTLNVADIAPVATSATVSTSEGVPLNGFVTGTDANGDALTFAVGATLPANGTVVVNPDGSFVYTPAAGFTGVDTFSFTASDGTLTSAPGLITVNVTPVANTAPVVVDGSGSTTVGVGLGGSLSPLGSDAENDPLTYSVVAQPTHGTLALSPDGTFTYTPDAGFIGTDSFTFKANDGSLDSNVATFNLTVTEVVLLTLDLAPTGTIATKTRAVVPLDSNASLTNVDPSVSFAGTTIQASFVGDSDTRHDKLLVKKIRGSDLKVTCMKIKLDGQVIAKISGGRRGQPLTITFDGSATQATVTRVLDRIAAKTTKSSPDTPRSVRVDVIAANASANDTIVLTKV